METGTRLGPYEVVSRIGAGGMGEVYKARDTRLDRSVAIKVLPSEFARNAQLKVRFEREAKAISQLNHPHICTLYDVGDDYLVMELLEGETLAQRLEKGALPLADVLRFGAQIADALDRAHKAGIVHRDLKPGNIMLTKAGAKLLDFGLAKTGAQQVDPNSATVQQQDQPLTTEGTILGTFQYMAPEQLEAEEADARTDIFALGAVLYEMATGKRAFQGKTKTSLIAAIVGAQPQPVSQLIPLSPPALDHVIQKCLEKEREDRWQSAHDVAEELRWIATAPVEQKARSGKAAKLAIAAAVLLAIALAAMTAMYVRAKNAPKPRASFAILPPKGFRFAGCAISPDGTMIAFSSFAGQNDGGLWIRRIDELEPRRVTTSPDDRFILWSPDSKSIGYLRRGPNDWQFVKVAVNGGTPEVIAPYVRNVTSALWSPDGTIVYGRTISEGLFAIRPDAPEPVPVTTCDRKRRESFHAVVALLGDGKRFLYLVHTIASQKNEIWVGSTDGKLKKMLFRADSVVGLAQGHLYLIRDGAIFAQRFDEKELRLEGQPRRVADRVRFLEQAGGASASVAATGALLYEPVLEQKVEWGWFDRNGRRVEKVFEEPGMYARSLSPDGKKVAAVRFEPSKGANDIYVVDLERGLRTRLTSGLSDNAWPSWSPSSDRIYFGSDRDGPYDIYAQAEDGASPPVAIWKSDRDKNVNDITPSGDALIVDEMSVDGQRDLWLVPVDAPEKRRSLIATDADEFGATVSFDGRWLAYISDRSGRRELYMRPLAGGRTTQISTQGSFGYQWGRDSATLYVRNAENARLAVPLTFNSDVVIPGKPQLLFTQPAPTYSMLADREKGFFITLVPEAADYIFPMYYDSAPLQ